MKKILYSMLAIAMTAFTLTSCEDVPMPYDDPNNNEKPDTPVVTEDKPSGDGTLANPFNAAAARNHAASLEVGAETETDFYIKGKVVSISEEFTTQYGNATFEIADTETSSNTFIIYRALYLGNTKYKEGEENIKVGDEVVVCGKITNYNGKYETTQNKAYIYSLNGKTSSEGGGDTPVPGEAKGDGTLENPFNSVAANQYASSLAENKVSDKVVYIKGKISKIKENFTAQYGNASFYISDDGTSTNDFYVYRTLYLDNKKYTEGDLLSVGDEVIVCGKVTNYVSQYGSTFETYQNESYLYSWTKNGGSTGGDDNPGGEVTENSITVTSVSFGLSNGTEVGTQTLADGTVLTFDGGGNNNAPKYYDAGKNIRMYPKNSMTIKSSKKISSVILRCDTFNGTICNASGDVAAVPGTVDVNNEVITVSGVNATETKISNTSTQTKEKSQIRFVSLTINYTE